MDDIKDKVKDKIKEIISEICDVDAAEISDDLNLFEEELLDSLDFIRLAVEISNEFSIDLDPADIEREQIETVERIVQIIAEKKG